MISLMTDVEIVALGEPLIEMVRLPENPNGAPIFQQGVGGDVLNAMVAVARQGGSAGLISAVGGDPFGAAILDFCKSEGIDTRAVITRPHDPTGVCFIDPDPTNRSFFYARRGSAASRYCVDDLPEKLIACARVLHVSAISQAISASMRETVEAAARIARANGTLVSYDLNLRLNLWSLDDAKSCVQNFLPLADIVLPSDDEAELLCGTRDQAAILEFFLGYNARYVLLKRGAEGAVLADGKTVKNIHAPNVIARDSTGAGDSFAGAFLTHYLETNDARDAAIKACAVAAQCVTSMGATSAIPYRAR